MGNLKGLVSATKKRFKQSSAYEVQWWIPPSTLVNWWFCLCSFKLRVIDENVANVFLSLYRWNSRMQCAPKLVCLSQDQPARMVVFQWLTSVLDYPWVSAWLISPDYIQASALQLERLDRCLPTTWLSGFSNDLPINEESHLTISEKNGCSYTNSWKAIKHSGQFSNQIHINI